MMSRLTLALYALTCVFIMIPDAASAQAPTGSYEDNALRVDESRGNIKIVRGVSEAVVARMGVFRGSDVASIVSPSPNAVAQAKIFEHNYGPGTLLASLGIATLGAAIGASRIDGLNRAIPTGLTIVSVGLITYGGSRLEDAYRALSKSIWWYNRDLKK
jgi:hypothetical protein